MKFAEIYKDKNFIFSTSVHNYISMIQGAKGHAFHACMKKHDLFDPQNTEK